MGGEDVQGSDADRVLQVDLEMDDAQQDADKVPLAAILGNLSQSGEDDPPDIDGCAALLEDHHVAEIGLKRVPGDDEEGNPQKVPSDWSRKAEISSNCRWVDRSRSIPELVD